MNSQKKIKVLVVDDSLVFREVIKMGISAEPRIEVIAVASDPFEARDKILMFDPDVITCDIEMPRMNGIEFVRRLLPQYPVRVIMVSSVSGAVFDAMEAGAVDFVVKPNMKSSHSVKSFISDLTQKIKTASAARITISRSQNTAIKAADSMARGSNHIIAIGASTGGTEAIYSILRSLPAAVPGIVIVQHIPPVFSKMFAERLNAQTSLRVKEAETGDYLEQGTVLIAPGNEHLRLKKVGTRYRAECFQGDKVNGHCPSVDVLFESVAKESGGCAVGILLTGMGSDGAKGLLAMRLKGCRTIGQDEASSVVYGMPKEAFALGAVERQEALQNIPQALLSFLG